jgi:hypothetical protein
MSDITFHIGFRETVSLSVLSAALTKRFPLFRSEAEEIRVEEGGKVDRTKVFLMLRDFSTGFPQNLVNLER